MPDDRDAKYVMKADQPNNFIELFDFSWHEVSVADV